MNNIAYYLNQIVFAFQFLNKHERDACNNNKSLLFSLYPRAFTVVVYFFLASYSLSNMFINFLKWSELSSWCVGICLATIVTMLLINIMAEQRQNFSGNKFYFRLMQLIVVIITFSGLISELPHIYAKDIYNHLIEKNESKLSRLKDTNAEKLKYVNELEKEKKTLVSKKSDILNEISINKSLPRTIIVMDKRNIYADGKKHYRRIANKPVIDEFNALEQQRDGILDQIAVIDKSLSEKDSLINESKELDKKINTVNAGSIESFDQFIELTKTTAGKISLSVAAVLATLVDLIVIMLTSAGKCNYSEVWQRINKAAKNESLSLIPNTTSKIRFRIK